MEIQKEELEIDLIDLFYFLKKKIVLIGAVFFLCALFGFTVSKFFMVPEYTASTRMYVLNRSNETSVISSDFTISNYMLNDYKVLITGQNVTKKVIQQLNLSMKPKDLAKIISVSAPDDTRVLQINVTHNNPQIAANIANAVREVAAEQIKAIVEADAVHTVYEAEVPEEKSGPYVARNTVIAAALGFLICVGILVVVFILDDTIRTEEDVERYLGLGTMGVIPISHELDTYGKTGHSGKKMAVSKPQYQKK